MSLLESAERLGRESGMESYADLYRRARGLLAGGARGGELVAEAERGLAAAGVGDPRTWSKVFLPAFDG